MKTRSSKTKISIFKFIPVTHPTTLKPKGIFFATHESLRVLRFLRVLIDRIFYMFLGDRVLLRVLSGEALFES